jgi:hypothetical protein
MKATLMLADSAQTDPAGKVHALGLGWSNISTPSPPIALIAMLDIPWDQTNTKHKLAIELLDGDGQPVSFENGPLGNAVPAVQIEAEIEAGRPPGLSPGTPIRQSFAIQIGPGMPLVAGQKYEFHMSINGDHTDSWLATFSVVG